MFDWDIRNRNIIEELFRKLDRNKSYHKGWLWLWKKMLVMWKANWEQSICYEGSQSVLW